MTGRESGILITEDIFRSDWVFLLLIAPVLLYLLVSTVDKYSLTRIIKIVFSNKFSSSKYRMITPGNEFFQMMLGILSLISISTWLYFLELYFDLHFFGLSDYRLLLFNLLLAVLAIAFRYVINKMVALISRSQDSFGEYFFNISRSYKLMGILLMIFNFFISYMVSIPDKYLVYISLLFVSILVLLRVIRFFYIFMKRRFSLFYMILYLCALEIFPVLLLIKYLEGQV